MNSHYLPEKRIERLDIDDAISNNKDIVTKDYLPFFKKMDDTKLDGRYLELFFPLFLISNDIKEEILNDICQYYPICTSKTDGCTTDAICSLKRFYAKYPNYQELGIGSKR